MGGFPKGTALDPFERSYWGQRNNVFGSSSWEGLDRYRHTSEARSEGGSWVPIRELSGEPVGVRSLDGYAWSAVHLRRLGKLEALETLALRSWPGRGLDDEALAPLLRIPRLRCLGLRGDQAFTGETLGRLARLPLETLALGKTRIDDAGLLELAPLAETLTGLDLVCEQDNTPAFTPQGVARLLRTLSGLRSVRLYGSDDEILRALEGHDLRRLELLGCPSDRGLARLLSAQPRLQWLTCSAGDSRVAKAIRGLQGLKGLDLSSSPETPALVYRPSLVALGVGGDQFRGELRRKGAWPRLRSLSVGVGPDMEGSLEALASSRLEHLDLSNNKYFLTDEGLAQVGRIRSLRTLDLSYCYRITNDGLRNLAGLSQLQELNLLACKLTAKPVKLLAAALGMEATRARTAGQEFFLTRGEGAPD